MSHTLDERGVLTWLRRASDAVGDSRAALDAVNVYPVPDGDTGTNLYLTLIDGCAEMDDAVATGGREDAGAAMAAFAKGCLLGARGNSGVIASQIMRALAISWRGHQEIDVDALVLGLCDAADAAWKAVARPVDGTMLTVIREAAQAAEVCRQRATEVEGLLADVAVAAADAAHAALIKTTEQLDALRAAGVVDAGSGGIVLILDALVAVVADADRGSRPREIDRILAQRTSTARPDPLRSAQLLDHAERDGEGEFEVMYVLQDDLSGSAARVTQDLVRELMAELERIGDCVAIVGGEGLWQVHVHTDEVAAAITAAPRSAQRQVTVRHLADHDLAASEGLAVGSHRTTVGLVACVRAPGLAAELTRAGAVVLVEPTGRAPSVAELIRAIAETGAAEVVVLGDESAATVVRAASRTLDDRLDAGWRGHQDRVVVHPMTAASDVHVLAAAAVFDRRSTDINKTLRALRDAVDGVRLLRVEANGREDLFAAVDSLVTVSDNLVTLLVDQDVPDAIVSEAVTRLANDFPDAEVATYDAYRPGTKVVIGAEA